MSRLSGVTRSNERIQTVTVEFGLKALDLGITIGHLHLEMASVLVSEHFVCVDCSQLLLELHESDGNLEIDKCILVL